MTKCPATPLKSRLVSPAGAQAQELVYSPESTLQQRTDNLIASCNPKHLLPFYLYNLRVRWHHCRWNRSILRQFMIVLLLLYFIVFLSSKSVSFFFCFRYSRRVRSLYFIASMDMWSDAFEITVFEPEVGNNGEMCSSTWML